MNGGLVFIPPFVIYQIYLYNFILRNKPEKQK